MLRGLVRNTVSIKTAGRTRPALPQFRTFTTKSSPTDHSNFEGVKNNSNIADHSNFNGSKLRDGLADNVVESLRQDSKLKHSVAARTGDLSLEMEARAEQSMADRINNITTSQPQLQAKIYDLESAEEVAQILKWDAAQKQSLADKLHDNELKTEASWEQSLADSILPTHDNPQHSARQQNMQTAQEPQGKENYNIAVHVGDKTFYSPQELSADAAQKQKEANRIHSKTLMNEAKIEQGIADALSTNKDQQSLKGKSEEDYDIFEEVSMEYYENDYPDNYTSTETRSSQL
jgi:hypothetical protein